MVQSFPIPTQTSIPPPPQNIRRLEIHVHLDIVSRANIARAGFAKQTSCSVPSHNTYNINVLWTFNVQGSRCTYMVGMAAFHFIALVSFSEIGKIRPIFRWQRKAKKKRMESLQAATPPLAGCMNASRSNGPKLPLEEEEREREREGEKGEQKYKSLHA